MMRRRWFPPEPVLFVRFWMIGTGLTTISTGLFLLVLAFWRLTNPVPTPLPIAVWVQRTFQFAFVLGVSAQGVCWLMMGLSEALWTKPKSPSASSSP